MHHLRAAETSELADRDVVGSFGIQLMGETLDVGGGPLPAAARSTENGAEARGLNLLGGVKFDTVATTTTLP